MKIMLKLAWRSLWRNWRRSLITIAAIFFAVFLMTGMRGIQKGTYAANIERAVELFTSYLQIQEDTYFDTPTLRKSFKLNLETIGYLKQNEKITGYAPRIMSDGLIGKDDNSFGAAIIAMNPEMEKGVSNIHEKVKKGNFISTKKPLGIVIGEKLADNLKVAVGDEVVILASGYDGAMGNMKFTIEGTIRTGSDEFDRMSVFMTTRAANELLSMNGRVSTVAVGLTSFEHLEEVKAELAGILPGEKLKVLDWQELMPEMVQSIEFDNASGLIYQFLLLLIVGFGILNTVVMSVTERSREFGVMLAIGTKKGIIIAAVFLETIFMSILGLAIGLVAGYAVNAYIVLNPIEITGTSAEMYEQFGFIPQIHSSLTPEVFTLTTISTIVVVLLVFIYPAIKLSKLEALKGIRYV